MHPVPPNVAATNPLARDLAVVLLAASVLASVFAGTFPFDFAAPAGSAIEQFRRYFDWRWLPRGVGYSDRIENLLFLMPLGFTVAAFVRPRRFRALGQIVVSGVVGTAMSVTLEVLQAFVGFRDPALVDVWCNGLGAAGAAGAYALFGDRLLVWAARAALTLRSLAKPWLLGTLLALYGLFHLWVPIAMRPAADLGFWDPGMPLLVGNELSGNRPWSGIVADVILADRGVTGPTIESLYRGSVPRELIGESLLAHYPLRAGRVPFLDEAGHLPPLDWVKLPSPETNPLGVVVSFQHWLKTSDPVGSAVERISKTNEFTFCATVATSSLVQRGPARVAGISGGTGQRNVQISQDESDVVFRIRTAVNVMPDLYLRDVFADTAMHQIAVKMRDGVIVTYVDGAERGRCQITPEAKVIWRMYPRPTFRLRLEHYGYRSYAIVYRMLVFIPFAVLLSAAVLTSQLSRIAKRVTAIALVIAYAIPLEIILARQAGYPFQVRNFVLSLLIAVPTMALIAWWRRRRGRVLMSLSDGVKMSG